MKLSPSVLENIPQRIQTNKKLSIKGTRVFISEFQNFNSTSKETGFGKSIEILVRRNELGMGFVDTRFLGSI